VHLTNNADNFLAPVLGPSATIILHHLSRNLRPPALEVTYQLTDLSHLCGMGLAVRGTGLLIRTLARIEHFGFLHHGGDGRCEIRSQVPLLSHRHVAQLPIELQIIAPVR